MCPQCNHSWSEHDGQGCQHRNPDGSAWWQCLCARKPDDWKRRDAIARFERRLSKRGSIFS